MSARNSLRKVENVSSRKRLAYTLAAGAAVAALDMANAQAEVVYSGPQDLEVLLGLGAQPIEFDTDSYTDLVLKNYIFGGGNYQGLTISFYPGKVAGFQVGNIDYVSALAVGTVVDSTTAGPDFKGSMAYGALNPNAQFNNITNGYIGLSFPIGGNTPDVLHYAWMRVDVNNAAGTFIVRDWAWEDEGGVGITVGDTGATAGDYDGDGDADGADFLAWQRGESPVPFSADDLTTWQTSFNGGALTAAATAVPEPLTLGMLAAGSAGLLLMRRLRQR